LKHHFINAEPLLLENMGRGVLFLLYAHNKCDGVSEATSKMVSSNRETIPKSLS